MRIKPVVFLCLLFSPVLLGSAQATSYRWKTDYGGNWNTPTQWHPTGVPYVFGDSATVARDSVWATQVTLTGGAAVSQLMIGQGNTVNIDGSMGEMYFGSPAGESTCQLTVVGKLFVRDDATLRVSGDLSIFTGYVLTIGGGGVIRISTGSVVGPVNFGRIVLAPGTTIIGGGSDTQPSSVGGWSEELPFANQGVIIADAAYIQISKLRNDGMVIDGEYHGGKLSTRNHGTLVLSGAVRGGLIQPGDGRVVMKGAFLKAAIIDSGRVDVSLDSQVGGAMELWPGAEIVIPSGVMLSPNNASFTNDGLVKVAPGGRLRIWEGQTWFNGSGRLELESRSTVLESMNAPVDWVVNGPDHTIEGAGYFQAWILNLGTILLNRSSTVCYGQLSGSGSLCIEGPDAMHTTVLDYRATQPLTTGDLNLGEFSSLILLNNPNLCVSGDFSFAQQDETLWPLGSKTLAMVGTTSWQKLEIGGEDLGQVPAGFTNNFQIATLHLEAGARVCLVDEIDNGNRRSPEAVYVNSLILDSGAELNLNGLKLYTWVTIGGTPTLSLIDESNYHEFGGYFIGSFVNWPVGVSGGPPLRAAILTNRPNPFNPSTRIEFSVSARVPVTLDVFDVAGRRVSRLADAVFEAGIHHVDWDGTTMAGQSAGSGVYFGVLAAGNERSVKKMVMLK